MLSLTFEQTSPLRILCLGAHSDDIEIGCGGTILKLIQRYPHLSVDWIVFGANHQQRVLEAEASAEAFLEGVAEKRIIVKGFRDSYFPHLGVEIKEFFEELKTTTPDLIFTHYRNDLHQDHRLLCELTWNTFRDHLILEYEIPKYDGDMGNPNLFVHLDEALCQRKIKNLIEHFQTQQNRHWFSEDTFLALLRLRGIESRSPHRYAEAFYCRKMIL